MASCCKTCNHRNHAVHTASPTPTLLNVCLITLRFKAPISNTNSVPYTALNSLLNDIADSTESSSHPTAFTAWSPCLTDPKVAVIVTTAGDAWQKATSPIFGHVLRYLTQPPRIQNVYLDFSICAIGCSSPDDRYACDLITLEAPNANVASAIGRRFGWEPKRSSLSAQMEVGSSAALQRSGDLIRDFWAWAELGGGDPVSPSSSAGSEYEGMFVQNDSAHYRSDEERNVALMLEGEEKGSRTDNETLIMLFQWSSHADAERFKHPLQKSYGRNGEVVNSDFWDRHVANQVRHIEGHGGKVQNFKLELRGVEERIPARESARERSGSKRLSVMALELGDRVSGLWR